ncbi:MAG: hypothetical protein Tsb002_01570 [Wenzhouxiangellaceae bacterium]
MSLQQAGWQQVFVAEHPLQASALAGYLEAAGLRTRVSGLELWGVAVEILFSEGAAPAVWVPLRQVQAATELITEWRQQDATAEPGSDWNCAECQASVPGGYGVCWRCGAEEPAPAADQQ